MKNVLTLHYIGLSCNKYTALHYLKSAIFFRYDIMWTHLLEHVDAAHDAHGLQSDTHPESLHDLHPLQACVVVNEPNNGKKRKIKRTPVVRDRVMCRPSISHEHHELRIGGSLLL